MQSNLVGESQPAGGYKNVIMEYIQENTHSFCLCTMKYTIVKNRSYWTMLDKELKAYAAEIGLDYVTNDDSMTRGFNAPPVIVNYFYHEQIKNLQERTMEAMPELPEVETIKRVIGPQIQGLIIEKVIVKRPEVIANPAAEEFLRASDRTNHFPYDTQGKISDYPVKQ